jgi:AraC-like DNA-binding protein
MLIYSDYSYMDIALSLGFSSQSAFNSVFRKATGMTPGQFRQAAAIGPEGV